MAPTTLAKTAIQDVGILGEPEVEADQTCVVPATRSLGWGRALFQLHSCEQPPLKRRCKAPQDLHVLLCMDSSHAVQAARRHDCPVEAFNAKHL